jgi:hypothetical protein
MDLQLYLQLFNKICLVERKNQRLTGTFNIVSLTFNQVCFIKEL